MHCCTVYCFTVALLYCFTVALMPCCTVAPLHCSIVALLYCYCCIGVLWHCSTVYCCTVATLYYRTIADPSIVEFSFFEPFPFSRHQPAATLNFSSQLLMQLFDLCQCILCFPSVVSCQIPKFLGQLSDYVRMSSLAPNMTRLTMSFRLARNGGIAATLSWIIKYKNLRPLCGCGDKQAELAPANKAKNDQNTPDQRTSKLELLESRMDPHHQGTKCANKGSDLQEINSCPIFLGKKKHKKGIFGRGALYPSLQMTYHFPILVTHGTLLHFALSHTWHSVKLGT